MKEAPERRIPDTIIGGSTKPKIINTAVESYLQGLSDFGFSYPWDPILKLPGVQETIQQVYNERVTDITQFVSEILLDINERINVWDSQSYRDLIQKDGALWHETELPLHFSVFACVDKGIPFEAVIGVDGDINRTLGGDIQLFYSGSRETFFMDFSALKKGVIHERRVIEGADVIVLLEHLGCGRRAQIVSNEEEDNDIPSLGVVFDHIDAFKSEYGADEFAEAKLEKIQGLWNSLERVGPAVMTPDNGLYAGIVYKIAQRIALKNITKNPETVIPILAYDKMDGNFFAGLDNLDVLTHPTVLSEGGFTQNAIDILVKEGKIFSLRNQVEIFDLVAETQLNGQSLPKRTYEELQNQWEKVQSELVTVTEALWNGYTEETKQSKFFRRVVNEYLHHAVPTSIKTNLSEAKLEAVSNRLVHQLFHVAAYAYHLNTFEVGNAPGHHLEDHLATGNHDLGSRRHLPLGQGFLEKPTASEMYTGYYVLHHSIPGKDEGFAVPVMIKCDTDKEMHEAISYPESRATLEDFRTFLNLWPYFLVGDLIPFVIIKQKSGGISRLAKSIILTYEDIALLLEREDIKLPRYVPAATSNGTVVLVPAREVLLTGVKTGTSVNDFRHEMKHVADRFAFTEYQHAFARANEA